ncbi:MAG TPA: sigma-54 dependent transcriptional regulator [Polyangia bacterium]
MALPLPSAVYRRVLVVDDEENLRHMLTVLLQREGYEVSAVANGAAALAEIQARTYDLVLADVRMPQMGGLELLEELRRRHIPATVIMMSAYGNVETALEAMKRGAYDYISKPFKPDEVVLVLRKAEERERLFRENQRLREALAHTRPPDDDGLPGMIGRSPRMHEIYRTVRKIAAYKSTVLLTGESGTGKELIARAVHQLSPRAPQPFVAVNCGAIPDTLLESELFGDRRGAFTDATRDRKGLFEEAHGGTLFLDELGELPIGLQVKLLRALQSEEIRRLGDTQDIRVDVRVIAATARDLGAEVAAGRFREDLYYRLSVLPLHLPPLRERKEDIPELVEFFLARCSARMGRGGAVVEGVTPEAMKLFLDYAWPGNVRELENTIEHALVLCEGSRVDIEVLPAKVRECRDRLRQTLDAGDLSIKKTTRIVEEELIRKVLKKTGGNRTKAAEILEISHRALLYKLKEFGIQDL